MKVLRKLGVKIPSLPAQNVNISFSADRGTVGIVSVVSAAIVSCVAIKAHSTFNYKLQMAKREWDLQDRQYKMDKRIEEAVRRKRSELVK